MSEENKEIYEWVAIANGGVYNYYKSFEEAFNSMLRKGYRFGEFLVQPTNTVIYR